MIKTIALIAAAALALTGCNKSSDTSNAAAPLAPVAAVAAPAGGDWTTTVAATPDGGFVMGNPNAKVKLVEYGSLSCPHCAHFAETAEPILKSQYIATGKISFEYRNYVRDGFDMTAALLARCGGASPYFAIQDQLFATQKEWLYDKAAKLGDADLKPLQALPPAQQFQALAEKIGLLDFVAQRGISKDKAKACLADDAALKKLTAMRDKANTTYNLQGTPTFIINGAVVPDSSDWAALEPKLKSAIGG